MRGTARTRAAVAAALLMLALASSADAAPTTAPAGLRITATTATGFSLAWDAPSEAGVTSSGITAAATNSTYRFDIESVNGPSLTSGDINGLTCGTTYNIRVSWSDGTATGPSSSISGPTTACTHPTAAAPAGLTATPVSAGTIRFSWNDSADPAAVEIARSIVGPLHSDKPQPMLRGAHATQYDAPWLICGETYTFYVGWVNDEGGLAPLSSAQVTMADCSTLGAPRPGPSAVAITSPGLNGYTLRFDAKPSGDVIGYRLAASGPNVDTHDWSNTFFAGPDTFSRIAFTATCGETYTVSVAWVFTDGSISQPTSTSAAAPACRAAPPQVVTPPPPPKDTTRPIVTLVKKRLLLNKKGVLRIRLACGAPESHCSGTLTLRPGKNGPRWRLPAVCGKAVFRLRGGTTRTVNVPLRRAALAALRKRGALRLSVTIASRDDAGNRASSKIGVRALR